MSNGYLDDNTEEDQVAQSELEDDSVFDGLLSQQNARADILKSRMQQTDTAKAALLPMDQESIVGAKEALARSGIAPQNVGPGFVEGYLKAQDNRRADAASRRADKGAEIAQGEFGIKNEKNSWDREAHAKEDMIQQGMADAGKEGGYEAVIDYLKGADPARAMQFQDAKNSLDASMMKNQVMQAALPSEKTKAMVEGYGALGNMGASILRAKPEDQQAMYDAMQPMIKTINPDAPSDVTDALPMFKLAMGQATPANIMYGESKALSGLNSAASQLEADIKARELKGETGDNSEGLKTLYAQRAIIRDREATQAIKVSNAKLDGLNKAQSNDMQTMQATEGISKDLRAASKDFMGYMTTLQNINGNLDALVKDPLNTVAMNGLNRTYAMANNKGATSEIDAKLGYSAGGGPELLKKLQSMTGESTVILNPKEIKLLATALKETEKERVSFQQSLESQYRQSTNSYTDNEGKPLVKWDNIRKPSEMYFKYIHQREAEKKTGIPADLQAMADNALKQNKDPKLVAETLQKLVAERKANAQQ